MDCPLLLRASWVVISILLLAVGCSSTTDQQGQPEKAPGAQSPAPSPAPPRPPSPPLSPSPSPPQQQQQQQGNSPAPPAVNASLGVTDMRHDVFKFWLQHGPDTQFGGFHGTLDRQGNPIEPSSKTIIQQARHLWSFSALLIKLRDNQQQQQQTAVNQTAVRSAADSLLRFMRRNMATTITTDDIPDALADKASNAVGGTAFVYEVFKEGANTRQGINVADPSINLQANAFAIQGLAKYAQATGSSEARSLALATFGTIDALYQSPDTRGYDETHTIGGTLFGNVSLQATEDTNSSGSASASGRDGSEGGGALSQSSGSLLQMAIALTELSRAAPGANPTVQARLLELVELLTGPMVVQGSGSSPEGSGQAGSSLSGPSQAAARPYLAGNYDPSSWTPVGDVASVNYGMNVQAAWLLADAVDELAARGAISSADTAAAKKSVLLAIGQAALQAGYDSARGGVYENGPPPSQLTGDSAPATNKVWWVQAEALAGLGWLYNQTGQQQYARQLSQTLDFVKQHMVDQQYGEWYWQVAAAGGPPLAYKAGDRQFGADVKGNAWKASLHTGRALLALEQLGYA